MDTSHYLLRWNDHLATYADLFLTLREQDEFIDCSFACDDGLVGAHRIVLAGCSPYLRELLKRANNPHPIIFLLDTPRAIVVLLMEFIYRGQVHIPQNRLNQLLILGQSMKITGLTEVVSPGIDLGRDPSVLVPSHSVRRPSTLSLINRRSSPTEMDSDGPVTIAPSKSCVTPTRQEESSALCDNLNTSLEVGVGLTPSTSITADEVITEVHSSHTNSGDEGESAPTMENSPSHTNSSEEINVSASAGEGEGSGANLPQEKEDVVSHPADPQTKKTHDESGHVDSPTTSTSTTVPVRRKATASGAVSDSEKPCPLSKKRKQGEAKPVVIYDRFTHLQHVLRTERSPEENNLKMQKKLRASTSSRTSQQMKTNAKNKKKRKSITMNRKVVTKVKNHPVVNGKQTATIDTKKPKHVNSVEAKYLIGSFALKNGIKAAEAYVVKKYGVKLREKTIQNMANFVVSFRKQSLSKANKDKSVSTSSEQLKSKGNARGFCLLCEMALSLHEVVEVTQGVTTIINRSKQRGDGIAQKMKGRSSVLLHKSCRQSYCYYRA